MYSSRAGHALQQITTQSSNMVDGPDPASQVDHDPHSEDTVLVPASISQNTIVGEQGPVPVSVKSTLRARQPSNMSPIANTTPKYKGSGDDLVNMTPRLGAGANSPRPQPNGSSTWDRPPAPIHCPFSSADAYAQPMEVLNPSRPGTALSQLSADGWLHDGTGNRSSYSTTYSATANPTKRASVLSFQTANSGGGMDGFMSGDEGRESSRGEDFEEAAEAPARRIDTTQAAHTQMQPWLQSTSNGYASSSDERTFPGGLPSVKWDDWSAQFDSFTRPPTSARQSPASLPIPLPPAPTAPATQSPRTTGTNLAPISTQDISKSKATALSVPTPTTARPVSDDATQIGASSPVIDALPQETAKADAAKPPSGSFQRETSSKSITSDPSNAPLSDNVIPPPLPADVAAALRNGDAPAPVVAPAAQRPVSDFRRKPLADISREQQAAGLAHLQALSDPTRPSEIVSSPTKMIQNQIKAEQARRASVASLSPTAALAQPPTVQLMNEEGPPSMETPSRESSPPPDGEVEARAEWERSQMRRKQREAATAKSSKSGTLRGQLKPLQLVAAAELASTSEDRSSSPAIGLDSVVSGSGMSRANGASRLSSLDNSKAAAVTPTSDAVSTQQLQRNQAREQRRSVGALSATMAAANMVSSGSNGPYPVFTSPTGMLKKSGSKQYPGLMPQRSLVPPFELQNRPDGLPSGLIGPDGIRRSINDPEVCLECMMRDEDMIDVHVVGNGLWERESDKEFDEAVRVEIEEEAKLRTAQEDGSGSMYETSSLQGGSAQRHGGSSSEPGPGRAAGAPRPYKKIGRGEPLTVERLKLHTQMNPPASSHRWRTLQNFLAVQAKYIAMEQQRLKFKAERRRSAIVTGRTPSGDSSIDAGRMSPVSLASGREVMSGVRNRNSSASLLKNSILVDDEKLTPAEREAKERDIALARAARSKNAAVPLSDSFSAPTSGIPPLPPLPKAPQTLQAVAEDDHRRFSTPVAPSLSAEVLNSASIPRRSMAALPMTPGRTNSSQDLRVIPSTSPTVPYPASPAESLAPPSRPFAPASPSAGSRLASRSGASQLSLMHSGSMVDMHLSLEDRIEHRLNQNGFIPGTPLPVESPGAVSRAYYGFPGDGDVPAPEVAAQQVRVLPGEGYADPDEVRPEGMRSPSLNRSESTKRKKKGLRGLISKLTGNNSGVGNASSVTSGTGASSVNGSVVSRNASKRSRSSSSPRATYVSLPQDGSANLPVPPPLSGFLSRAHRSTSSLFNPNAGAAENDSDQRARLSSQIFPPFQNPPGMASQSSLDLGPFQPSSPGSPRGAADGQRMWQASNSLMQKYLNSPTPQTQASRFPSSPPSRSITSQNGTFDDACGSRISSYASNKDLRSQTLQIIPDGNNHERASMDVIRRFPGPTNGSGFEDKGDQRSMSSISRSSLRKELPPMPEGIVESSGQPQVPPKHSRSGSNGPLPPGRQSMSGTYGNRAITSPGGSSVWQMSDASGRQSMQSSRPAISFVKPPMQSQGRFPGQATIPNGSSVVSGDQLADGGPKRPPRNPRRPDQLVGSPSFSSFSGSEQEVTPNQASFGQAMRTEFPIESPSDASPRPVTSMEYENGKNRSRKSTFLRLPFGRKKRESTMGASTPSGMTSGGIENIPSQPRTSNIGLGPPPMLRNRQSYSALAPPKASFQMERQRVLSSPVDDRRGLPPRSQSAFGMLSTQRFASSDARMSRDGRGPFGDEEEEDDDEDDGMGYDRDYQPGLMEASIHTRGGNASFGRKSLNLLREGLHLPSSKSSTGDERKKSRFGF